MERLLITVKTYPTLSEKYGETVCTAAVREDGSWVRLYPIPFRRLNEQEKYRLFDWIECRMIRNSNDHRPETHRLEEDTPIRKIGHLGTRDNWRDRRKVMLENGHVYYSLENVINDAKENKISLATFKPTKVLNFKWTKTEREWDQQKLNRMRWTQGQFSLFDNVRRAKALAPSGCEARPANCRSSRKPSERVMEVTTWTEALRRDGPPYGRLSEHAGRNASERRAGLEKDDAEADPPLFRGRQPASGKRATRAPGVSAGVLAAACVPEGDGGNTGSPVGGVHAPTGLPRGTGRAGQGGGEARSTGEAG